MNVADVMSSRSVRRVNNDWTLSYRRRRLQLLRASRAALAAGTGYRIRPGQQVELRAWLDGSVHIYANGHEIRWVEVSERTAATTARGQVA